MPLLCTSGSELDANYSSVIPQHELNACNKPAVYRYGSPNKNYFYFCEQHANYLRNTSGWNSVIAKSLIPLTEEEKLKDNVDFDGLK
jgi:hypothetical protein